ncbi:39055_t:CDS:2, partial [Gigaspora margarita]
IEEIIDLYAQIPTFHPDYKPIIDRLPPSIVNKAFDQLLNFKRNPVLPEEITERSDRIENYLRQKDEINHQVKKDIDILCQRLLEYNENTFGKFMREITNEHEERVKANKKLRYEVEEKKIELREAEKILASLKSHSTH